MIVFFENYIVKSDSRGVMKGLINQGCWRELNYFSTKAGQIRGNHYHKNTDELFIILDGKIEIEWESVNSEGKKISHPKTEIVQEGDVFIIRKGTRHKFRILENTNWINGLSQKMDEKNPDLFI